MAVESVLFAAGYPLSLAVISRFVPVVRERRWAWLVAHHAGVTAVIAGWALKGRAPAVAVNGAWLVTSSVWYVLGSRR
ncbi:MAG TPA: hypothetical protein VK975_07220 [Acidimicrobiales bacterium]|nr:hypothetical protein [Acidimicrobiales bacterium]